MRAPDAIVEESGRGTEPGGARLPARVAIVLWFVWDVLLFGGFLYGLLTLQGDEARQHIPTFCRMGSSAVLVLAALVGVWGASGTAAMFYAATLAVGMALGFVGDLFNAGFIQGVFKDPVMGGIVAFALGHIAYIAGGVSLARRARLTDRSKWIAAITFWQAFGLVGWFFVVFLAGDVGPLHWAALPYSLLLAGTAGVTTALGLQDGKFVPLAVGGALFLASDLILAFGMFRGGFAWIGDCVWLTYGPGQMLIVYSLWPALRRLALR